MSVQRGAVAVLPEAPAAPAGRTVARKRPNRWRLLSGDPKLRLGLTLLGIILLMAVFSPQLSRHDPLEPDLLARLAKPAWMAGGNPDRVLGGDALGRDVWARLTLGARTSLLVGVAATALSVLVGVSLGVLAGFRGSWPDKLLMRIADIQMAFPSILLALAVMVVLGASLVNLILVLGIGNWVIFARVMRAEVLSLREREFIQASQALGASGLRVVLRHILPNVVGSATVLATLTIARVVIAEASLSYLGLGIPPPSPSWGGMLADGRQYLAAAWWASIFPGLALMATVVAINLLGDWLRDVLDPRLGPRRSELAS